MTWTSSVPLGVHRYGHQVVAWEPARQPHMLVVGPTGSGKTTAQRLVALNAVAAGASVMVLDGNGGADYVPLVGIEHLELHRGPVAVDATMRRVDRALADRFDSGRVPARPLVVIIDELAALALPLPGEASKDTRARVDLLRSTLARTAFQGRAAEIHLVIGQQRPDVADGALSGSVRDQLTARLALGWLSPEGSRMVFGSGVDVEQIDERPGNGWAVGLEGCPLGRPVPVVIEDGGWL